MRVALAGGREEHPRRALADLDGTMPGRGAYLCRGADPESPNQACVEQAMRRGAIARALRCAVTVDPKLVESVKRVAQPAAGRPAGPLAISKS
jgi:predicted RNA-binding protein YlxR (DUF448 family)